MNTPIRLELISVFDVLLIKSAMRGLKLLRLLSLLNLKTFSNFILKNEKKKYCEIHFLCINNKYLGSRWMNVLSPIVIKPM